MPVSSLDQHGQESLPMPPQEEAVFVEPEPAREEEVFPAIELPDEEEFAFDDFDPSDDEEAAAPVGRGGWTIPVLCAGIALIACCVLIPQANLNRRLAYERMALKMEMDSIEKQVAVNDQFLKKVADDPELAERLAQRQMKIIRQGTRVLELKHDDGMKMSPFQLVNVAPPPPLPPYQPVGGTLAALCCDAKSRLYLSGCSLIMIAMGLVLGYAPKK